MSDTPGKEITVRSPYDGAAVIDNYELIARAKASLASEISAHKITVPETEVTNWFAKDLYSRWLKLPAGSVAVGEIHKFEHFFMVVSGTCVISNGDSKLEITGPQMFISPAGAQRVCLALTDTVVATFHANIKESADMIAECTSSGAEEFQKFLGVKS